jgi:hypothetical protein
LAVFPKPFDFETMVKSLEEGFSPPPAVSSPSTAEAGAEELPAAR